jgi:hypothetical protein
MLIDRDYCSSNLANLKISSLSFQLLPATSTSSDPAYKTKIAISDYIASETPSSRLEEYDNTELTAICHESILTYFAEKGAENLHHASQEPIDQKIYRSVSSDSGQLALTIAGKTQPEQNRHTKPKHVLTAANTDAQAKFVESRTLPLPPGLHLGGLAPPRQLIAKLQRHH